MSDGNASVLQVGKLYVTDGGTALCTVSVTLDSGTVEKHHLTGDSARWAAGLFVGERLTIG